MSLKSCTHSLIRESKRAFNLLFILFRLRVVKLFLLVTLIVAIYPLILFYFLKPKQALHINYGITFSQKYASSLGLNWQDSYIKMLDELNVRHFRLVAYWDDIEPTKGKLNFDDIRWQLTEAGKRNAKVIMTIGRKVPRYPECFEPIWWKDIRNKDEKEQELINYVQRAITELKGYDSIVMWQVENEPQFPFGVCDPIDISVFPKEIQAAKKLDSRPVITQDSGEGGLWIPYYKLGDYLGISMYRKVWFDYWGLVAGKNTYVKYPIANWAYKIKADLLGIPEEKIFVTELQTEPWGNKPLNKMSKAEKDLTLSALDFTDTLRYAQGSGFTDIYLWGAEWWLWEKQYNNNSFFWDTATALFNSKL